MEARHRAGRERLHGKVQERNARELREWEQRFVGRENEARRREHQERLKHLSVSRWTVCIQWISSNGNTLGTL